MDEPGIYSLLDPAGAGDFTITSAGTFTGEWVENLAGMLSLAAQLRLAYGSGGTNVKAYLQTSLDQGNTAIDIACVVFGIAGETEVLNFSALTPKTTQVAPTDGGLADDTAIDGILGDRVRLKIVVTGTYGGSTVLSGRVCVR